MQLPQLKRVRWAVRGVLTLGVAASVAANILHADPNLISEIIAAWPPLALLLAIELVSRVPVHRRWQAIVRRGGTTLIAGIAAWVSYWHMVGVAQRYGETGAAPYLLPLSVDGLVLVASVSLVELAGRIRALEQPVSVAVTPVTSPAAVTAAPATAADIRPAIEPAAQRPAARPAKTAKAATDTATRVAKLAAKRPDITPAIVAANLEISERTARRHLSAIRTDSPADNTPATVPDTPPANGTPVPELVDVH